MDANIALGFKPDEREYGIGVCILKELGINKVRLITNNPDKAIALMKYEIEVTETIPVEIDPNSDNVLYMETKKEKMGHLLQKV